MGSSGRVGLRLPRPLEPEEEEEDEGERDMACAVRDRRRNVFVIIYVGCISPEPIIAEAGGKAEAPTLT